MKNWAVLLLIIALATGCASVNNITTSKNQEERIQKLLIGTWEGYIKDTSYWYKLVNRDLTLRIFEIRKEKDVWTVKADLNRRSLEYIKLQVYNNVVILEMLDKHGGLFTLEPYNDTHLLGNMSYGWGAFKTGDPRGVFLKKLR